MFVFGAEKFCQNRVFILVWENSENQLALPNKNAKPRETFEFFFENLYL